MLLFSELMYLLISLHHSGWLIQYHVIHHHVISGTGPS